MNGLASTVRCVTPDRSSLEILAPALSLVGSLIALLAALFGSDRSKVGVLSALLGAVGSAAWLATALDAQQADEALDAV